MTPKGAGSRKDMFASSLLFYVNLAESNFDGEKWEVADEKKLNAITPTRSLTFEFVSWSDLYEFGASYTAGTLGAEGTLFDGLACDDKDLTP